MPERKPEIEETYDRDMAFLTNLGNAMTDSRRLIKSVIKDWATMDPMTKNETIHRIHADVTIDLYERIKSLAEPRGYATDFEWDVATMVKEVEDELVPNDPAYESKILVLYSRLLARYQFWMDRMGILLQNRPPELFADSIIEAMEAEYKQFRMRTHAREAAKRAQ